MIVSPRPAGRMWDHVYATGSTYSGRLPAGTYTSQPGLEVRVYDFLWLPCTPCMGRAEQVTSAFVRALRV